jgi:hypothetical protein
MLTVNNTKMQDLNPTGTDNVNLTQKINKTYSTMLKFISGALIGGAKYSDIYMTSDDEDDDISRTSENKANTTEDHSNYHYKKVPTLQNIATKTAKLENRQLNEKQYIAYKMIACTSLLGLVKYGFDSNTTLFTFLQQTVGGQSSKETTDIVNRLKARGAKEQLPMFLTGLAGSGKRTAMRVAEQFCNEFCVAVGLCGVRERFCLQHTQDLQHH